MESDLLLARRAALTGAVIGLRYFAALAQLPQQLKPDGSVVTEADRAVEAAIREVLADARPDDAVLGEEAGQSGGGSRRWIVDPIDGTALFVAGDNRWLVLVALEEAGEILAGVAVVPAEGRIWWAQRGGGAFEADISGLSLTHERRIAVARHKPDILSGSRLGVIPTDDELSQSERDMIAPLSAVTSTRLWSTHAALLVACGQMDLAVQARGQVWDYAATSIIVEEAGGRFSGLDGQPQPMPGPALFTRSAATHTAALQILAEPGRLATPCDQYVERDVRAECRGSKKAAGTSNEVGPNRQLMAGGKCLPSSLGTRRHASTTSVRLPPVGVGLGHRQSGCRQQR